MRRHSKTLEMLLIMAIIVLVPTMAMATTMEYYCYGSFNPIVSALKLVSNIFGNSSYQHLFYTVITVAAVYTGLGVFTKIASGGNTSVLGWSVPMAIGIVMYLAFFVPKGSLQVYDEVLNKTELVTNVPEGIVLVAGTFNAIERGLVEIVSTAGASGCYQYQAGGKGFLGLNALTTRPLAGKTSIYLEQNLNYYIKDCVTFAVNNTASALTIDELRRTPASFSTSLAKAQNPAIYTLRLSSGDPLGANTSCTDAWTGIVADMTPAELSTNLESVCSEIGYNVANPAEFGQCKIAINDAKNFVGLGALGLDDFVKQQFIKNRLDGAYQSGNSQVVSNYNFLTNVSGSMKSFNEYYPVLRGVLTGVALALIPILVIFLPTPLSGKIASILFGFFIWLTTWGVVDAILHGFAMEYANDVYSQVRDQGLGLDALYFFPNASVKALAMFGTLRMSGLVLSTALTGMLVKFGGHALTQMGSSLQGQVSAAGAAGARQAEDIVGQSQALSALAPAGAPTASWASAPMAVREAGAYGGMVGRTASGLNTVGGIGEVGGVDNLYGLSGGMGHMDTSRNMGAVQNWQAGMQAGREMGMSTGDMRAIQSMFLSPGPFNTAMNRLQAQAGQNNWTGDQAAQAFFAGKVLDDMKSSTMGSDGGFNLSQVVTSDSVATVGEKGGMRMTWGTNGNLQSSSGFDQALNVSAVETNGYSTRIANSRSETESHLQSAGYSIMGALTNSSTRSRLNSLAQTSSSVSSGIRDTTKALETGISHAAEKAASITDSQGNVIEKGSKAWSRAVTQAKAGLEFLGTGIGGGTDAGGEKGLTVKTSGGHTYTFGFGDKESKMIAQKAGETWRDSTSKSKGTEKSSTDQSNISEAYAVTNTRSAMDQVTASEQRTRSLEDARTASINRSASANTALNTAMIGWLGEKFGGGIQGDIKAANMIQDLASTGTKESLGQLSQLQEQFIAERGLHVSGEGFPNVAGPSVDTPSRSGVLHAVAGTAGNLKHKQQSMPHPAGAPRNLRQQIAATKPHQGLSGPNEVGYQRYLSAVHGNMETAGNVMKNINDSPIAPDHVFWGSRGGQTNVTPNAKDVSNGYVYENVFLSDSILESIGGSKTTDAGSVTPSKGLSVQKKRR